MQYIRFAREEPELYRLLLLMRPDDLGIGTFATMRHMQELQVVNLLTGHGSVDTILQMAEVMI